MTYPNESVEADPEFEQAYDAAEYEAPAPEGFHQCVIQDVVYRITKKSGDKLIEWTLKILGGEHTGLVFKKVSFLSDPQRAKWVKQDFSLMGLVCPFKQVLELLPTLKGARLEVQVIRKGGYLNTYFQRRIDVDTAAGTDAPPLPSDKDIPF